MSILNKKIVATPGTLAQEVGDSIVLLNLDTEHYYGLDQVGMRFWQLIVVNPSIEAAVQSLLSEYAVEPELLENDITRLVNALKDAQLISFLGEG